MMQNNDSKYDNAPQAASRTRKSFFNFGNWLILFAIDPHEMIDICFIIFVKLENDDKLEWKCKNDGTCIKIVLNIKS
jgi:hypothetical protein